MQRTLLLGPIVHHLDASGGLGVSSNWYGNCEQCTASGARSTVRRFAHALSVFRDVPNGRRLTRLRLRGDSVLTI